MTERLTRVVLGVRKATPHDEELKIIVFSPSFVLHLINEVLRLVPLGESSETVLLFLPLPPSPVFVLSLLFPIFGTRDNFFFGKTKKGPIFF